MQTSPRLSTGVPGLDHLLQGGLPAQKSYLLRGGPGVGKTTLGLQFLLAGARQGESVLFISLEEPEEKIRRDAAERGWDLSAVHFLDLGPSSEFFQKSLTYDIFSPAEVERDPLTRKIIQQLQHLKPARVFLDPLTQFRYLATDLFQYRRQVLSFLRFLNEQGTTVLFTSESSAEAPDEDLQFLSDGILQLERGPHGVNIEVRKMRGSDFAPGPHTVKINAQGLHVFPRLVPEAHSRPHTRETMASGIAELDRLLGGGLERGTITFISGPSGVGKTTLAMQLATAMAQKGERAMVYSFEEEIDILQGRCEAVGMRLRSLQDARRLELRKIEPLHYTPAEFAAIVREDVEQRQTRIVLIDSAEGFKLSLQGEDLVTHLHALCKYLQHMGVVILVILETHSLLVQGGATDIRASYMADNLITLRFVEIAGEMRRVIGVLKKRLSDFEKSLREFAVTPRGIYIGPPLKEFRGLLTGVPEWQGDAAPPIAPAP
ncbi:MAG: AAA family ATPase [Verrucomicrobiae bacterium]|nr:AAA family ATPase [Verrucomicrobiae bacterium]